MICIMFFMIIRNTCQGKWCALSKIIRTLTSRGWWIKKACINLGEIWWIDKKNERIIIKANIIWLR